MVPCSHGLEEWLGISGICEKSAREVSGHGTSSSTEFTWASSGMGDSNLWGVGIFTCIRFASLMIS